LVDTSPACGMCVHSLIVTLLAACSFWLPFVNCMHVQITKGTGMQVSKEAAQGSLLASAYTSRGSACACSSRSLQASGRLETRFSFGSSVAPMQCSGPMAGVLSQTARHHPGKPCGFSVPASCFSCRPTSALCFFYFVYSIEGDQMYCNP